MGNQAFWDAIYRDYDLEAEIAQVPRFPLTQDLLRAWGRYLPSGAVALLEDGCGAGRWNFWLEARKELRISAGVDFAAAGLALAQSYVRNNQRGAPLFVRGDLAQLPFRDGTFDLVTNFGCLGHLENPAQAVGEMKRVLRPGGIIFADVVNRTGLYRLRRRLTPLVGERENLYRPKELAQLFAQEGLEVLESYARDFSFLLVQVLKPPLELKGRWPRFYRLWFYLVEGIRRLVGMASPFAGRWGFFSVVVARRPRI